MKPSWGSLASFFPRRSIPIVHSFFSSSSTSSRRWPHSKTLAHLIRSGHLLQAQRLFDSLRSPDVSAYNTIISAHVKARDLPRARQLFDKMPHRDVASYNALLSGYALSNVAEELEDGRRLFDQMPVKDPISWNTMINGYARNTRMKDALELFDRMPDRDVTTWNTVINGYFNAGDVHKALELFESMPERDAATLSTVVSGLARMGRLEEAEEILLRSGGEIEGSVDAFNTLIAKYGRCGKVEDARTLFYLIPKNSKRLKKNVISWNSMLMCYVSSGDLVSARGLFEEMPERDLVSWNTMISGYVKGKEMDEAVSLFERLMEPDAWSWNAIICGLSQNGELRRAREFFDRMPCKNLVSWNSMVAGYEKNGDYERAIELFAGMQAADEQPDKHTLSSVLSACAGLASFRLGIQIHQLVLKRILSDAPINNALITMYSRCGALLHAKDVFVEMAVQNRDVVSWNAMIGGLAYHGHAHEALELFRAMKTAKVKPTYITFISVLNACRHAGLVDDGKREFDSMVREFGLKPRVEHYASLVDLIGTHGQLEDAMMVIKEMVVPPDKVVWGALLSASRIHKDLRFVQMAAEALARVDPDSSAPYVMLYNVNADEGRWGDAVEAREVMDKSGIVKQPGYSWIELDGTVHKFLSGDRYHPCSSQILSMLESCNRICREVCF